MMVYNILEFNSFVCNEKFASEKLGLLTQIVGKDEGGEVTEVRIDGAMKTNSYSDCFSKYFMALSEACIQKHGFT